MASYFDEHNCEPLADGTAPDHMLHLARMLQEGGYMEEFEELFGQIQSSPPASKKFVDNLPELEIQKTDINEEFMCAVCRAEYTTEDRPKILPCSHKFHVSCIVPWLKKTNSCPECRFELPTDDEAYEAMKKHKQREAQRKHELESLHDSMYG